LLLIHVTYRPVDGAGGKDGAASKDGSGGKDGAASKDGSGSKDGAGSGDCTTESGAFTVVTDD